MRRDAGAPCRVALRIAVRTFVNRSPSIPEETEMTTDLHHKITEAIKTAEFATRRMGPPPSPFGSLNVSDLADALRAVVELCVDRQAEAVDGGMTDVDTVWPSVVLTVIAHELGIEAP